MLGNDQSVQLLLLRSMGPLQPSGHVVQNRQTGEQMTHWDKENSNLVALFNMSQCALGHVLQRKFKFGGFV